MSETLTIQSAVSIDVASARQLLRDALPVARFIAQRFQWGWSEEAVDALEAIVDSDPLWTFFEGLLGTPEGAELSIAELPAEAAEDARREEISPEVIIALLPTLIKLAQWLIKARQERRGG